MFNEITESELGQLRKKYPAGTKVILDFMDDDYAPKPGTIGTVLSVDDTGTVFCSWESGGSLGLVYGVDRYHKL